MWVQNLFGKRAGQRPRTRRRETRRAIRNAVRWLRVESLEERTLLSVGGLGGETYASLVAEIASRATIFETEDPVDAAHVRQTTNFNAADTTNSDQLWLGGGLNLDLNGANYTVGVWDGGWIRDTHQEFQLPVGGSRVTIQDQGNDPGDEDPDFAVEDHGTHVGGTIGADGNPLNDNDPNARGMVNEVDLWSYGWTNDLSELEAAASTIAASNHSYAYTRGWTYTYRNGPNGLKYYGMWYGRRDLGDEDQDFGKYDSETQSLDATLYDNPDVLSVWAAGNERGEDWADLDPWYYTRFGPNPDDWDWRRVDDPVHPAPPADGSHDGGYDTLPQMQAAKNNLVVGAIDDIVVDPYNNGDIAMTTFSDWGPTDDGRIKPDVVANGYQLHSTVAYDPITGNPSNTEYDGDLALGDENAWDGTSMASPNVAGTAIQLIEHYENQIASDPLSATIKGTLIHTAFDVDDNGPDYTFGWGLVDAAAAATFITDAAVTASDYSLFELPYYDLDDDHLTVKVDSDGTDPLKVTIVWTDPAGTANTGGLDDSTAALVNDLDLWITGPGGTYRPWTLNPASPASAAVRTTANHLDNVEQVLIDSPGAGTYTIHVGHTGELTGTQQDFSLLISEAAVTPEILFTGFATKNMDFQVDYTIIADVANLAQFDIGIYRSSNGSSLDAQLMYQAVTSSADRTRGGHSVVFDADFSDPKQDYYLMAKVDSAGDITEGFEDNNQGVFSGGAFLNLDPPFPYILDVHGTDALNDTVDVTLDGFVKVTLNGVLAGQAPPSYVSEVHVRTHDGDDTLTIGDGINKALWVFGGDDDDTLEGGGGDDYLDGGAGDDTYVFTGSANLGEDTIAESSVGGNDLGDTLDFSGLSRAVSIDLADDTQSQAVATDLALILEDGNAIEDVLGTALADVLIGNSRSNFLSGGAGNDSLKGGAGNDRLEGGAGNDRLEGGSGDDTYLFAGSGPLGQDTIAEFSQPSPDISRDKLDFTNLAYRVQVYLSNTDDQQVATKLRLTLSDANAIEVVFGTAYNDVIWGNDRDNVLYGNAGNDTISGGEGDDTVYGGLGDDMPVDYTITAGNGSLPEFDVGIYRSSNGSPLDALLMSQPVTSSADRSQAGPGCCAEKSFCLAV